ncbi:MAG: type II toxin-antitoxin system RelB/DinJ family antitoxin [Candidatus Gracilibacteria bacterium]|nr:type II toxin-antitoxin system RelB/DinJ family antitoxin [Candidatus Gracilibacteria bacterium]
MTTLTIRLDDKLKKETSALAKNMGLSLNQLINLKLREFVNTGTININLFKKELNEDAIELFQISADDLTPEQRDKYNNRHNLNYVNL